MNHNKELLRGLWVGLLGFKVYGLGPPFSELGKLFFSLGIRPHRSICVSMSKSLDIER